MYRVEAGIKVATSISGVKEKAWNSLFPLWAAHTKDFPLDYDACTLYDKDWTEISDSVWNSTVKKFYKETKKKNGNISSFKPPNKVRVDMCIPFSTWLAFEELEEEQALQEAAELAARPEDRSDAHDSDEVSFFIT